jgi:hypothetical protein
MYECMHVCMYSMYVCMYVCMYICVKALTLTRQINALRRQPLQVNSTKIVCCMYVCINIEWNAEMYVCRKKRIYVYFLLLVPYASYLYINVCIHQFACICVCMYVVGLLPVDEMVHGAQKISREVNAEQRPPVAIHTYIHTYIHTFS